MLLGQKLKPAVGFDLENTSLLARENVNTHHPLINKTIRNGNRQTNTLLFRFDIRFHDICYFGSTLTDLRRFGKMLIFSYALRVIPL